MYWKIFQYLFGKSTREGLAGVKDKQINSKKLPEIKKRKIVNA